MKRAMKTFFRILLGVFFVVAGINHFRAPEFYLNLMPDYLPAHEALVYASGVTEVIAGIMLFVPSLAMWGAWFIVAHLVVFFTVHFWMIQHAERYPDVPVWALWLRIVFQVVFIVWALWFVTPESGKGKTKAEAAA